MTSSRQIPRRSRRFLMRHKHDKVEALRDTLKRHGGVIVQPTGAYTCFTVINSTRGRLECKVISTGECLSVHLNVLEETYFHGDVTCVAHPVEVPHVLENKWFEDFKPYILQQSRQLPRLSLDLLRVIRDFVTPVYRYKLDECLLYKNLLCRDEDRRVARLEEVDL